VDLCLPVFCCLPVITSYPVLLPHPNKAYPKIALDFIRLLRLQLLRSTRLVCLTWKVYFPPPPPIVSTPSPIDSQWLLSEDSLSEDSVGPHSSPTSSISSLNEATMSDGPTIDNRRKHPSNQSRSTPAMNQPSQESSQDSPLSPCKASARRRIF
jgi:hypothetical protein